MTDTAMVAAKTTPAPETKETPLANVDANMFRAAYVCASREGTRYYLNGVYVTPHPDGGALLIATDGHRMIVIHDSSAWCRESCIVQVDKIGLDACKPPSKRVASKPIVGAGKIVESLKSESKERRLVIQHDGTAEVPGVWRSPARVLIDGTFPDWRRVCPFDSKWERRTAAFNPKLIADFGEIGAILRGSKEPSCAVRIVTDGPGDPALVQIGDQTHAFGIIMPMRGAEREGFPQWMKPIESAVRALRKKLHKRKPEKKRAAETATAQPPAQPIPEKPKSNARRIKKRAKKPAPVKSRKRVTKRKRRAA